MKLSLLNGIDKQDHDEVVASFKASHYFRQQLIKVLEKKIEANRKEMIKKENYEKASWTADMADYIGHERALREVISLLSEKNLK